MFFERLNAFHGFLRGKAPRLFSCLEAGELYLEGDNPLLGSGGFLPPDHPLSPAPLGAAAPRPRVRSHEAISPFKRTFVASLGVFWASKVFLLLPRRVFGLRVRSQSLARRVFGLWECSHGFHRKAEPCLRLFVCSHHSHFCRFAAKTTKTREAILGFGHAPKASRGSFSCFGSAPEALPTHFHPLGVLPRLSLRISGLWERSHGFPRAFPGFGSIPKASPAQFQALGVLPRIPRSVFTLWECSHGFHRSALRCLRLFVCSQCSHFCRFAAKSTKTRAFFGLFCSQFCVAAQCAAYRVFLRKTRAFFWQKTQKFAAFTAKNTKTRGLSGVCPNAHTGIVRAWRGNHTKSFHQEDEPWQRRQLQR